MRRAPRASPGGATTSPSPATSAPRPRLDACLWQADVDLSTCAAGCQLATPPGTAGPLVHLPFNGGFENRGSVGGTATGNVSGYDTDRCGRAGGAAMFDTDDVQTPSVSLFGGAITYAVWIKTSDVSGQDGIIAQPLNAARQSLINLSNGNFRARELPEESRAIPWGWGSRPPFSTATGITSS